ncbi:MAG: chemotaxis protein CheW [Gemmatimonadota bacterium]
MSGANSFLLVRVDRLSVGLPLEDVIEVKDLGAVHPVPSVIPSMRGVTLARGHLVPIFHLGALLRGGPIGENPTAAGVLVDVQGLSICLEVDEADFVSDGERLPVPPGESMPWATSVVRRPEGLIPILNLSALAERLAEAKPIS